MNAIEPFAFVGLLAAHTRNSKDSGYAWGSTTIRYASVHCISTHDATVTEFYFQHLLSMLFVRL